MSDIRDELDPPFEIIEPERCDGPVVFNSPHSGSSYPRDFLAVSRLDIATLRRSEDSFVDELALGVVRRGYPLMRAHFPRCYVDVNREPYELDPRMFDGRLPSFANTRSMRVAGGLGTIARVVGDAQEIYGQRIPVDHAIRRIETLYKPYHRALRRLFTRIHRDFGVAVLIDCHSMPSTAGSKYQPRAERGFGRPLRNKLRTGGGRNDRDDVARARAIRSAVTSLTPAALSPSITAIRPPVCMPCSLNLTAHYTWTSGVTNARREFRAARCRPGDFGRSRWPKSQSRNCGLIARPPNNKKTQGTKKRAAPVGTAQV